MFMNGVARRRTARRIAVESGNDVLDAGQTTKVEIEDWSAVLDKNDVLLHGKRLRTTERKVKGRKLRELARVVLGTGRIKTIWMSEGVRRCAGC